MTASFFDTAYASRAARARLDDVDPALSAAAPELSISTRDLRRGPWEPADDDGLLVVAGVLVRTVKVGRQPRAELLGAGDVVWPGDEEHAIATVPFEVCWSVLEPARVAVLDTPFFAATAARPAVGATLARRSARRAHRLAFQLALGDLRHIEDRLIALFLHLGDRWGRVTPEGIQLRLRLTHDLIAHLVGAQRPTVTTGLNELERAGRLIRRPDRVWVVRRQARPSAA